MTLYSKWFNTHSEYEAYKNSQDYILPNVSICYQDFDVHYEKYVRDYSKEYLTFEAIEDTEFSIVYVHGKGAYVTQDMRESFSYSVDNGETWVTFETPNDTYSGTALTTPTIHRGEKVLWKGIGNCNNNSSACCNVQSNGQFNVYGNIMSLIYGDNFIGETDLSNTTFTFNEFFSYSNLVSCENLVLPSTTLVQGCYMRMFEGCGSLTTAPKLPATTLAKSCYSNMFSNCTSLTSAPELPATTLANYCYSFMFSGCTNLNYIKAMFTTTPSTDYTQNWVYNVAFSGTFVKNSAATWSVTSDDGVPSGWTVEIADA